jgi:hypothetical protein
LNVAKKLQNLSYLSLGMAGLTDGRAHGCVSISNVTPRRYFAQQDVVGHDKRGDEWTPADAMTPAFLACPA